MSLEARVDRIEIRLRAIDERTERLETKVDARFEAIDGRLETIDRRFEAIDRRFEAIDRRFETIDRRFDAIDQRLDAMNTKFDELHIHIKVIAEHFDSTFALLYDWVKARADESDRRYEELKRADAANRADFWTAIRLTYAPLDKRVIALEQRARRAARPRR